MAAKKDLLKITFVPSLSVGFHFVDNSDPNVTVEYVPDKGDLNRLQNQLNAGELTWRCEIKTTCEDKPHMSKKNRVWRRVFVYLRKVVKNFDGTSGSKKVQKIVEVKPDVMKEPTFQRLVVVDFRNGNTKENDFHNWSLRTQEEMREDGKTVKRIIIWSFSVDNCRWMPTSNKVLLCEIVNEEKLPGTSYVGRKLRLIGPGYVVRKPVDQTQKIEEISAAVAA